MSALRQSLGRLAALAEALPSHPMLPNVNARPTLKLLEKLVLADAAPPPKPDGQRLQQVQRELEALIAQGDDLAGLQPKLLKESIWLLWQKEVWAIRWPYLIDRIFQNLLDATPFS